MNISQKNLLVIIGVLVVILVGYLIYNNIINGGTAGWQTMSNKEYGFSLKYPENFFEEGHEPQILVGDCNYQVFPMQCPDITAMVTDNDLKKIVPTRVTFNNTEYCSHFVADAVAGSQHYYNYFSRVKNDKCIIVALKTSTTTCSNYLPLDQGNSEQTEKYEECVEKFAQRLNTLGKITNTFKFK